MAAAHGSFAASVVCAQVEDAEKASQAGPLLGLDRQPLMLDGAPLLVKDAMVDWKKTALRLKVQSAADAKAVVKARLVALDSSRDDDDDEEERSWRALPNALRSRAATAGAPSLTARPSDRPGDAPGRARSKRVSMANFLLRGDRTKEALSDADIENIFALNGRAKVASIAPRVLEPLISLTLSDDPVELLAASKYIRELVWCTRISLPRVQYQALWALANLSQKRGAADAKLVALAAECGVALVEGDNLGARFRDLIVSTENIMRTVDDDAIDAVNQTFLTGAPHTSSTAPAPGTTCVSCFLCLKGVL
jgi:hypothetical protein